jgi:hypothetical protein
VAPSGLNEPQFPLVRRAPLENREIQDSRPGNDLTYRFPLIVETLARLGSRSCIIDGEAVGCDDNGITSFNLVRYRHCDEAYSCTPST